MKKVSLLIILILTTSTIGYFVGESQGKAQAYDYINNRNIESLKSELKRKENQQIKNFLKGNASIQTKNEGRLFKKKHVKYLTGSIRNKALIASAKDIKVNVSLISKTKSIIKNVEFTLYEYIPPGKSKSFKKKIDISEDVSEFKWTIIDAKPQ